ncbi:hypothetical protein [Dactylosporangium sp. CA-233914]|uniref:hypothetical protein n=1 Tax=Dactylosporangium sp. CA-233914 TaxID=3239934 RepID=UPI003D919D6E
MTVVGPRLPGGGPVVLGFDPADPRSAAVPYAFGAAQRHGAGLRICSVRPGEDQPWADDATLRRGISEAIAGWRGAFADVAVALDVAAGLDPLTRLLDVSAGAALIVVDSGSGCGFGAGQRLPDVLAREAVCPVAVVRPQRSHGRRPVPAG